VGLRLGSWLKVYNLEIDIGHRSWYRLRSMTTTGLNIVILDGMTARIEFYNSSMGSETVK
jgi:hypothetical protein